MIHPRTFSRIVGKWFNSQQPHKLARYKGAYFVIGDNSNIISMFICVSTTANDNQNIDEYSPVITQ